MSAGGGGHERGSGRDIERADAIAAGAAGVDERRDADFDMLCKFAHDARSGGDFIDGLTLHAQRNQQPGNLRRCCVTTHDRAHNALHIVETQVMAVHDQTDGSLDLHKNLRRPRGRA